MRSMCGRLSALLDGMRISDAELSRVLGYSNSTTIARMRKGEAFLDTERLAVLGSIVVMDGACPNIHWVVTGAGNPLAGPIRSKAVEAFELLVMQRISKSL